MSDKMVTFHDTTFRDGPQSLWGMKMNYGMIDAVVSEMDQAGFATIETIGAGQWVLWTRFLKEDPIAGMALFERKLQKTPMVCTHSMGMHLNPFFGAASPIPMMRYFNQTMFDAPHSQFIVSQAAVNVATGERYKEILDCMIEFALGIYGVEDAGVPYMDPNIKDMFLSHPNAKRIAEKWARDQEEAEKEVSLKDIKAKYGMENASDEEFWLNFYQIGDELKKIRANGPPKCYYTGKEPLVRLLKELRKDRDISRLQMQKGNSYFEFRQK